MLAGVLVLLTIAGCLFWWRSSAKEVVLVETVKVETGTQGSGRSSSKALNASGYVVARRMATVLSNLTGKIAEIYVQEGSTVQKGQALASLDDATAQARVALDESRVQLAQTALAEVEVRIAQNRRDLERLRVLVGRKLVSESSFDQAQSEVEAFEAKLATAKKEVVVARRQLELSRQELKDFVIRAPFSGVVVLLSAQPGEIISPVSAGDSYTRTGISTIVDMQSLEAEVDVNESYIDRVRPGQETEAMLEAYPQWKIPGYVVNTVPAVNRQKGTLKVRVAFKSLDPRILLNMGVQVEFLEDTAPHKNASPSEEVRKQLLIPEDAVKEGAESKYVFVVEDGLARRCFVEAGRVKSGRIEILAGLKGGEWVITSHEGMLADGAAVKVKRNGG